MKRSGDPSITGEPASVDNLPASLRWGYLGPLAVWLVIASVLYGLASIYLQPKAAVVTAEGELVIPRHRDGHFYVEGKVHGKPITFLVDTGASSVVVSQEFARSAGMPRGEPTTFHTANGSIQGSMVQGVAVSAGPFEISATRVGVGLVGDKPDRGLLGQSFLSRFDMAISKKELVLRRSKG